MAEVITWLDDGTAGGSPFSPRFGDRYRSELGGLDQAREVFLKGCGLPEAWAGQPQWRILETGFGLGLNFLVTWQAWKADPQRPRILHFVSTEAFPASAEDVLRSAASHPGLLPLAQQLHDQFWGLLPGFHRLVFEEGRVLLTLCIGDTKTVLRQQRFEADAVYLDGFSPQKNPDIWDIHTFKAVARCCRRGTRIATWTIARAVRDALAEAGFVVRKTPGIPPKRDNLQGEYNPAWTPKMPQGTLPSSNRITPGRCVVIGGGLAGAASAASLARRGWQVVVIDGAESPASGASGLPVGLLAPHVSPDDSLLSRLSRSGVRTTLQQAEHCLKAGQDWQATGVLEHLVDAGGQGKLPAALHRDWLQALSDWSRTASAEQLSQCGLPVSAQAVWHAKAGWIKPASLVGAWLKQPGIVWRGKADVSRLVFAGQGWRVLDAAGTVLAEADLVVLAAGHASRQLAATAHGAEAAIDIITPALQAIRGQVSWGHQGKEDLPPVPVNGHGSLISGVPMAGEHVWLAGSSFERDEDVPAIKPSDHQDNFQRLQVLLPQVAGQLADQFDGARLRGWAGIRCATPARLPVLGRLTPAESGAELWICSGMGSRGLTFAALCAELLAARLHDEPLPLEWRLAQALAARRQD